MEAGGLKGETTTREPTRLQQTLARRMAESKATAPDHALMTEADVGAALALGASFDAVLVRAAARALRDVPEVNGSYRDGRFEAYSRVNVGLVVEAQDALLVPVVLDADTKSLEAIDAELAELTAAARDGSIAAPRLAGGTFTVFRLGVRRFTAVLNPPQAAALAVGEPQERVVARDGAPAVATVCDLTLTCDHRVLYGSRPAAFLARLREHLEQPD